MQETPAQRKQISLRLPPEVLDQIDARRAPLRLSRDEWLRRAAEYCLALPIKEPTP